ncbi:putative ribosome-binding factor A, mitochondrial isoform X2 [Lineus longissimus]
MMSLQTGTSFNSPLSKPNHGNTRRAQQLSFLLHRYITEMLYGGEIDQEILNTGVQISKVQLLPDMTSLNITWTTTGTEQDAKTQQILENNAGKIRSALSSMYIMNRIPRITFVKDKFTARVGEVERLLKIADTGPETEQLHVDDHEETDLGSDSETDLSDPESRFELFNTDFSPKNNVLGLDHASLMQSVINSKTKSKDRSFEIEEEKTGSFRLENISPGQLNKHIEAKLRSRKMEKISKKETGLSRYVEDLSLYEERYKDTFDDEDVHYQEDCDEN